MNRDTIKERLDDEALFALDIADYLAEKGVAFSEAHHIVGRLISYALNKKIKISSIPLNELKGFAGEFGPEVTKIFDAKRSVMSKRSMGSTNPLLVRQQINRWSKYIK